MFMPNIPLYEPASVAGLAAFSSTELKVASTIAGRGHRQCLEGKYCLHMLGVEI